MRDEERKEPFSGESGNGEEPIEDGSTTPGTDQASVDADPTESEIEELQMSRDEVIDSERARAAEYLEQAQRARAELVNYRRRTEQEMEHARRMAGERIISKFLPAVDDLHRAIAAIPEEERDRSWAEGIMLIERKLWAILESEGVRPIESVGQPFDPSMHEAVSVREGANGATTVVEEYQRGYLMHDRVIRPAMVVVGNAPATGASESNTTEDTTSEND